MKIKINNKEINANIGQTVLDVCKENNIEIPALCFHSDLKPKGGCRLCLIEIKGKNGLHTSCSIKVESGMEIITESLKINKARKINLELLFAQHCEKCSECSWYDNCQILKLAKKYNVKITRFPDRKKDYPSYEFGPCIKFDSSKCIDCRNCVEICQKQSVDFLELESTNGFYKVVPSKDKYKDCIYCGQCVVHCPVGAIEAKEDFADVEKILNEKNTKKKKYVVFQFAPSIRTSIGEEFGLDYGTVITDNLVAAIKKLGAYRVFDTSVGADFTTIEESKELLKKLKCNCGPCLTSCCPSWVKFIEFNYPEFIGNLASTRSPQIILGGIIKGYWAKTEKINPKDVVVVSIMPCVSKKYEIKRKELKIDGLAPVDYVLTTRELACLLRKYKINLAKIKPQKADDLFGDPSGAGVLYGASGGVVESALRTVYEKSTGQILEKLEFEQVRGLEGVKKADIKLGDKLVKIVIVSGLVNARKILEELKRDPHAYDAVEVMACFGGCIGGGGQPLPTDDETRKKRAQALYNIDKSKEIRMAHKNPIIDKVYSEFLNSDKTIHKYCHTKYYKKKKEVK